MRNKNQKRKREIETGMRQKTERKEKENLKKDRERLIQDIDREHRDT